MRNYIFHFHRERKVHKFVKKPMRDAGSTMDYGRSIDDRLFTRPFRTSSQHTILFIINIINEPPNPTLVTRIILQRRNKSSVELRQYTDLTVKYDGSYSKGQRNISTNGAPIQP